MLEIKNYLWSLFTLTIVLRSPEKNSHREIQAEDTTMVRMSGIAQPLTPRRVL